MQDVLFVEQLSKKFIDELKQSKVGIYNPILHCDYSGCTDFLGKEVNKKICKIYFLLKHTSAMQLFEKYFAFGLYKIYNSQGSFTLNNFNNFTKLCREKSFTIKDDNPFFALFSAFALQFLALILSDIEEYARNNRIELIRRNQMSIIFEHLIDEFKPPLTCSASCPEF